MSALDNPKFGLARAWIDGALLDIERTNEPWLEYGADVRLVDCAMLCFTFT